MSDYPFTMKAEAEIARLRAALEKIAIANPARGGAQWNDEQAADHYWAAFDRCREIARAALEPKP